MTSRRMLKKKINNVVNDIIEECYSVQLMSNGKHHSETEKIIDEAVILFDGLLEKVQSGKKIKDGKEKKKHYESINIELEKGSLQLMGKLNKLS